ncbi:MAG: hypothetical protein V4722_27715 [Bacteroidota bacterium]
MQNLRRAMVAVAAIAIVSISCKKEKSETGGYNLVFKFKFDSTQVRLNNIGQPSVVAAGNAAQSPVFDKMSAHYIELAPTAITALGSGAVLYRATETNAGGGKAIDFEQSKFAANGETFYAVPLKTIAAGNYQWLRISLSYQQYDIKFRVDTVISGIAINQDLSGKAASFLGFNTYIKSYKINTQTVTENANRAQGYFGFESSITVLGTTYPTVSTHQPPPGATTVVNPLFATSPIPAGSCVVTAAFAPGQLSITGNETKDIIVEISLSTNKSFEWKDKVPNGKWEPFKGEEVVDMGIRGMVPTIK